MVDIYIARQPIYDSNNQLFGYELLYRGGETDVASFDDGKIASSEVILNGFLEIGFDGLVGSSNAFINITEDFILDEELTPMYANKTILEVLEDIKPSEKIFEGVKRLKDKGYRIALDDFIYSAEYDDLLSIANFVKLDVIRLSKDDIRHELDCLKAFNVKVIAEKIETPEMYGFCKSLNFDFYQGFYFCKPQLVKHKNIPSNKLVVLNLLKELHKSDFDFVDIEKALSQDATLTYKLLRYVNSAAFTNRKEINSIKEALVLVGGDTIRKWATLILMMQLVDGKPHDLLVAALVRAKMCELLESDVSKSMFTIGLFSLLDALMDVSLIDLLDELTLSSPIKLALLDYAGENGEMLRNVVRYEQGQWDEFLIHSQDVQVYFESYMEAVKWADFTMGSLHS